MTTWILILSIVRYSAVAVTPVPGVLSQEACLSAGTAWLKEMRVKGSYADYFTPSALCVASK